MDRIMESELGREGGRSDGPGHPCIAQGAALTNSGSRLLRASVLCNPSVPVHRCEQSRQPPFMTPACLQT